MSVEYDSDHNAITSSNTQGYKNCYSLSDAFYMSKPSNYLFSIIPSRLGRHLVTGDQHVIEAQRSTVQRGRNAETAPPLQPVSACYCSRCTTVFTARPICVQSLCASLCPVHRAPRLCFSSHPSPSRLDRGNSLEKVSDNCRTQALTQTSTDPTL